MKDLYGAFLRNRKKIGTTLLSMLLFAQLAPQVRAHENLSLALGILIVGLRQAGANKSDEFYRDRPELP